MNKTLEKQLLTLVEVIKKVQSKIDNNAASFDTEINEVLKTIDTKDKESNIAFKGILKTLEKLNNKVDKDTHDTNISSLKSELKALETILQSKIDNKQDIINIKEEIDNVVKDYATKKELDLVEDKIKLKQDTIDIKSEINKVVKDYATKNELSKALEKTIKEVKTEKIVETIKEQITTEKPNIEVGKVITAEAGSVAKVEIRKANDTYYLDFTIPKGTSGKGSRGANGVGVATGGTTNQVLAKNSNTDYDTKWVDNTGGTGTSDHSELTKLDYASAGHTGFQPAGDYLVANDIANKVDKETGKSLSTNDYTTDEKNKLSGIAIGAEVNVNADWNSATGDSQILNKPSLFSGSYTDLSDKPTIPAAQIQSDWNQATNTELDYIKNKPSIPSPYTLPTASTSVLGGVKIDNSTITITDGVISAVTGGSGDVTGPAGATADDIVIFNSTTGKIIKDSGKKLSDYQDTLVSGTNIKTVNSTDLLGSGNIVISDGADGQEVMLQTSATHVQWKYTDDVSWTDLIALADLKGDTGLTGAAGSNGTNGTNGTDGDDGTEIELQVSATHIQWRYVGAATWTDLILLSAITGAAGANGVDGSNGTDGVGITSIDYTSTLGLVDTYTITYTDNSTDTFDVTNGAAGSNGTNGTNGSDGTDGSTPYIQGGYWYIDGTSTGVLATGPKGDKGDTGSQGIQGIQGPAGSNGTNGTNGTDGTDAAEITSAAFDGNDIKFTKDDATTFSLTDAKITLKGEKGDKGDKGDTGLTGATGATGADGEDGADGLTTSVNGVTQVAGAITIDPDDLDDTSTSHKFVTATDLTNLSNLSGTNTGDQTLPVKASGAEINTGTDDAKFTTAKAIADSTIVKGPASSVDSYLPAFDGITGKLLKDSKVKYVTNVAGSFVSSRVFSLDSYGVGGTQIKLVSDNDEGNYISGLANPTVNDRAANKAYVDTNAFTAEKAQDAVGTILTDTTTIDFTYTDETPSITASVKDASITYAKIQNVSATDRILGRDSAGAGSIEEITPVNLVAMIKSSLVDTIYPVGAIYTSVVSTSPATLFGGTWSAFGAGKVLVGLDSGNTAFDTVEETGGAETVTLTAAQSGLPAHNHTVKGQYPFTAGALEWVVQPCNTATPGGNPSNTIGNNTAANASQSHTNLQPYIVVYMWKRTA